jgi:hypothetical protein
MFVAVTTTAVVYVFKKCDVVPKGNCRNKETTMTVGREYLIDFSSPCRVPFSGAERVSPPKSGLVKIQLRADILYLDENPLNLFLSREQKKGGSVGGHDLWREIDA